MIKIDLPFAVKRPILACGADLKGAFMFAEGRRAFLFEGFGDLGGVENLDRYEKAAKRASRDLGITPKIIACDMHPGYFSSRFARTINDSRLTIDEIQHHEAHIASAVTDNAVRGDVIGVAFDGTGYGLDGNIWGGEFFVGNPKAFKRAGHFDYMPMPGGEAAVREPWRMAASYLYRAFGDGFLKLRIDFVKNINRGSWATMRKMIDRGINSPLTSSAGRLFDAAGSIILARNRASAEAELPMALEKMAARSCGEAYRFDIKSSGGTGGIDMTKAVKDMVRDLEKGIDKETVSAKFHNTIARVILDMCVLLGKKYNLRKVVLSGGVFQNRYLTAKALGLLSGRGFKVYTHSKVSASDSGLPLGQVAIANARTICV